MLPLLRQGAVEGAFQSLDSPTDGEPHGCGVVRNGGGWKAIQVGFHSATLDLLAPLVTFLVAQVDFHSDESLAEPTQIVFHLARDVRHKLLSTFDVIVRIHQDLHWTMSSCGSPGLSSLN